MPQFCASSGGVEGQLRYQDRQLPFWPTQSNREQLPFLEIIEDLPLL
jgi:hypothetical protein